jgi:hypothetical protein
MKNSKVKNALIDLYLYLNPSLKKSSSEENIVTINNIIVQIIAIIIALLKKERKFIFKFKRYRRK